MAQSIFEAVTLGFNGGREIARQRRRDVAMAAAGQSYQRGDYKGAESSLMGAGLVDEANAYGEMGERSADRERREKIRTAMIAPGSTQERATRGRDAAFEAGDMETAFNLDDHIATMDDRQKKQMAEVTEWGGGITLGLVERGVPEAERKAAFLQALAQSPYDSPQARARIEAQTDWSDNALKAKAAEAMSVAERLAGRERQERYAVDDRQWQQSFQQSEREMGQRAAERAEARGDRKRAKLTDLRQMRNDFERGMKGYNELRENLSLVLPRAQQFAENGGRATGNAQNQRVTDGAMLMIAARMVQGAGILSDQDIAIIQGNTLDGFISNAAGYVSGQQSMSAGQRQALADLIVRRSGNIDQAVRDFHQEHADFARENDIDPDAAGIRLPPYLRRQQEPDPGRVVEAGDPRGALNLRSPREARADEAARPANVPANAVSYLRQNDTPQMRTAFDAKYGRGAAARVLGARPAPAGQPGGYGGR